MNSDARLRIRNSMDLLVGTEQTFALLFYGKLFELDPSARALFHNDLDAQGAKLMKTLRVLCNSLENLESLLPTLREMGRKHAGYGVRLDQYDTVRIALLWTFAQALGPNFAPATRDAWQNTLDAVCAAMIAGACGPAAMPPLMSAAPPSPEQENTRGL